MQENVYSKNDNNNQGLKIIQDNGNIRWEVKKKDFDIAYKDKNIDPNLTIRFILRPFNDDFKNKSEPESKEATFLKPVYELEKASSSKSIQQITSGSDRKSSAGTTESLYGNVNVKKN
jgi:hypothetical protein